MSGQSFERYALKIDQWLDVISTSDLAYSRALHCYTMPSVTSCAYFDCILRSAYTLYRHIMPLTLCVHYNGHMYMCVCTFIHCTFVHGTLLNCFIQLCTCNSLIPWLECIRNMFECTSCENLILFTSDALSSVDLYTCTCTYTSWSTYNEQLACDRGQQIIVCICLCTP